DVAVAGLPRILQPRRGAGLVEEIDLVAEPIERLAQRRPPALLPVAAHTAATVPAPALDTMGAAPRRGLADLGLEPRWVGGEEGAVVRERRKLFGLDLLDDGGQRHVPEALVMTVGLAVGRAVNELGPVTRGRAAAAQPVDEALAALEGVLERDRARDRTIVEEEREAQIPRAAPEVRTTRIDAVVDLFPSVTADAPDAPGLVGGQDRELHAGLGQHLQRLVVGGGLGQPHALRLVPVVIRRGGVLDLDRFQPWVLAGRLVEVPVDRNGTVGHQGSSRPRRNSRRPPRGITTMPDPSTCQRRRSVSGSRPISLPAGTMLKRSTTARLMWAPLPTVVWSMMIESSITAPSFTHTLRPRIELRIVARFTSEPSAMWALSTSEPRKRAGGPG